MAEEKRTSDKNKEFPLIIEGDPAMSQKVRNVFSPGNIFKKEKDGTLICIINTAERPRDSGRWVPITYVQSANKKVAFSYDELLHWYNKGIIQLVEVGEEMSELVSNYKKK